MPTHWNIQIAIQRVEVTTPAPSRHPAGLVPSSGKTERDTIKVLDLAIVAETEDEAYERLALLLEASRPRRTVALQIGFGPKDAPPYPRPGPGAERD